MARAAIKTSWVAAIAFPVAFCLIFFASTLPMPLTAVVAVKVTPELQLAGVQLEWRTEDRHPLHPGTQRFLGAYGENDVILTCPNLSHPIDLFRHFSTNWRDAVAVTVSCEGNLDEIRCAFHDERKTYRVTTTCSKHDALRPVW